MEPIRVELDASEWVDLEPSVTVPMGMAAVYTIFSHPEASEAELRGLLAPIFMRFGIRDWSFRDGKAQIKVEPDSVARLLPFADAGFEVANRCMDLYLGDILRPLQARRNRLLVPGPTDDSISPTPGFGTKPPTPLSPSLPESTVGSPSVVPLP